MNKKSTPVIKNDAEEDIEEAIDSEIKVESTKVEPIKLSGKKCSAFLEAILQLSSLLGCPEPIPTVDFLFAKTMAFDITNLQMLKANFRLSS